MRLWGGLAKTLWTFTQDANKADWCGVLAVEDHPTVRRIYVFGVGPMPDQPPVQPDEILAAWGQATEG